MAVIEKSAARGAWVTIQDRLFACPVWLFGVATLTATTLVHGYHYSGAMPETIRMAADPFTQSPDVGPWSYQSPLGPILAHSLGATEARHIALVHYGVTFVVVLTAALAVARWASEFAARLFMLAYFCSPQSWAGTAALGVFDIVTVAALTVCTVAPAWACFAAGIVLGFNHFEQGGIALVAVAVIRLVVREERGPAMIAAFGGLAVGKTVLMWYLVSNAIATNGRLDFIRDKGLTKIIEGWRGQETIVLWAVYNVLWIGVIWMLTTMNRRDRWIVIGLQVMLTLPVLITFDLSRVYRNLTWPIVMLLVLYSADWNDKRLVQRWALLLAIAAVFVPRTEIWHNGVVIN